MTGTFSNPLAFALGVGFTMMPAYMPFVAVLLFFGHRWAPNRGDLLWLATAVAAAVPLGITGGLAGAAFGAAQVLGPWLVYAAFRELHGSGMLRGVRGPLAAGLLVGFGVMVLGGLAGIQAVHFDAAKTLAQAIVWNAPAALYGQTVLVLGALIAALAPDHRLRVASLGIAALGILVAGSRDAAMAWVIVAVGLMIVGPRGRRLGRAVEVAVLVVMLAIAGGLGPMLGWGRVGFLVDLATSQGSPNLLQGTEYPAGDWWDPLGVRVKTRSGMVGDARLMQFTVAKAQPESWRRLQQAVRLLPGERYTVSTFIAPAAAGSRPGIQGWGEGQGDRFVLSAVLENGAWHASATGAGRVLSLTDTPVSDGWHRVAVSFAYSGSGPLTWWLGLAPDQRERAGSVATFAGFMLTSGEAVVPYQAGVATRGLGLAAARLPYWRAAWQGFLQRPWSGWGQGTFADYVRAHTVDSDRLHEVPNHAHSFLLQQLFERGVGGALAAVLLIAGLSFSAVLRRDLPLLVAIAGVLVANIFDNTLLYGGVLYPLAAVAGWQSAATGARPRWGDAPRQAIVRIVLAAADTAAAFASLRAALWLGERLLGQPPGVSLSAGAAYLLLLWPLMAWREGLYPGYGLTPAQELRKHVGAVTVSVLLVAAVRLVLPTGLAVPGSTLAVLLAVGVIVSPLSRALAKRLLWAAKAWGRDVIVLGAGDTGSRMARALQRTPLDGLHPVAFFDDDPALQGGHVCNLPVVGPLASADAYAERQGVRHAIVAIPTLAASRLQSMLDRRSPSFDRVQFVPDLAGLPSEDVFASSIDGMLALEVRIGLYNAANRAVKRAWDIAGSVILLALASPLLLALYLWIRADSRGAGFHASHRIGEGGRPFACLKFRTMHVDAEQRLGELLEADARLRHEYARFHKLTSDPRVTRVGRVLRRLSLDELPQLFNVLLGEMSLVGPRPYLARELPDIGAIQDILFRAKPGMTGYWQVAARNDVTFRDRLQMEAHYVRNWSIWWDIVLLTQTPAAVVRRRGAK